MDGTAKKPDTADRSSDRPATLLVEADPAGATPTAPAQNIAAAASSEPPAHVAAADTDPPNQPAPRKMMRQFELVERVLAYAPDADEALLNRAYVYAMKAHSNQRRASGDPYFSHPLEVAAILTELQLDDATIATALLHDVIEDTEATRAEIDGLFGAEIGGLVEGLTKIKKLDLVTKKAEQAENFRKLVIAISSDIRVLLVKLADRLHNMRTLQHMKESSRLKISEETLDIYAPLAGRMGMQSFRDELEHHAFRWLRPQVYETVRDRLDALATRNHGLVDQITGDLAALLDEHGIEGTISARAKRPYSIWRKMQSRQISLEQLSDIYGFRVIVGSTADVYRLLGAVHTRWSAVPLRFKDYISTPKQNNYRSLHTTVVGPRNQRVELQLRTRDMHEVAEYGIAAHAIYADTKSNAHAAGAADRSAADQDLAALEGDLGPYVRLRRLVETLMEGNTPEEFYEHTKLELFQDQVFSFTPKGKLIALPSGATPIDFAFAVHTDVGTRAVGAIINGHQRPITSVLSNGDEVEILTREGQEPPAAWEKIAKTGRARAAIRRSTRDKVRRQYAELGRSLLAARLREADKMYSDAMIEAALPRLGRHAVGDVLSAVGRNELAVEDVVRVIAPEAGSKTAAAPSYLPRNRYDHAQGQDGWFNLSRKLGLKFRMDGGKEDATHEPHARSGVPIRGLNSDLPVVFDETGAVPGDRIVGVLIPGEGIRVFQIHAPRLQAYEHERWVDVTWDIDPSEPERFPARIMILARNEPGA
ncbi:MAG: bifunctional (p)ppGpp synthetase/guanosine-3',5'-bis(diphosphate) 3'-pyrophosphohydrolase, partial [Pseudomonadota bacterium]